MRLRKIDNFANWRKEAVKAGLYKINFPPLPQSGDTAELIGVVLGDGHIEKFPRTERLLIFSNSANQGFVKRYSNLVEKLFDKKTYVYKQTGQNCTRISLYEKNISRRLGIPTGSRKDISIIVPPWILKNREFIVRYLRGLYEAEGSASIHTPTYTYKFSFANTNQDLLKIVHMMMSDLGFHPSIDKLRVQVSRREEYFRAIEKLEFRKY